MKTQHGAVRGNSYWNQDEQDGKDLGNQTGLVQQTENCKLVASFPFS